MSNPLDDYIESYSEQKTANASRAARELGEGAQQAFSMRGLGMLGMSTALIGGASVLAGAARKAYMAAMKNMHHKEMMDVNPDLAEYQQRDPKMFNQHYNSLRRLNPTFASDPVVAGSYMRQMSEHPTNAGPILVQSMLSAPKPGGGVRDYSTALDIARSVGTPAEIERLKLMKAQNEAGMTHEE